MRLTPIVLSSAIAVALLQSVSAHADPVAAPGYSVGLFAAGPAGTSAADSVLVIGNDVYVGFGNGGNPDGSNGAVSTIVEFTLSVVAGGVNVMIGGVPLIACTLTYTLSETPWLP